jgi:hypothetical protein
LVINIKFYLVFSPQKVPPHPGLTDKPSWAAAGSNIGSQPFGSPLSF